jgi:hypothetical protein
MRTSKRGLAHIEFQARIDFSSELQHLLDRTLEVESWSELLRPVAQ